MLRADEVERCLAGAFRLMRHDPGGIDHFDTTIEGYWRSFFALILVLPAFVIVMAGQWQMLIQPLLGAYPSVDLWHFLALHGAAMLVNWFAWAAAALILTRITGVERRYVPFMVAYNWSCVPTAAIIASPMVLYLMGWALPPHAFVFTLAFLCIVAHFRWFLARTVLGVSSGVAGVFVMMDGLITLTLLQVTSVVALAG